MTILLDGVTFAYETRAGEEVVLSDLQFDLPAGRTVVVLGLSGLGKTTLLNLLGLLWDRGLKNGRILYTPPGSKDSQNYAALSSAEKARLRGVEFGFVPQVAHFLSGFTFRQNLRLPLEMQGKAMEADGRIAALLDAAAKSQDVPREASRDLHHLLDRYPDEASTGQRQRLSVLRAIVHDPPVLLADEPVSNLDVVNKRLILGLFRRWRNNDLAYQRKLTRTLVLVCHEADTAWEMADRDEDLFLFLRPRLAGESPGARVELMTRLDFCTKRGNGPDAIRRRVEETLPQLLNG